MTETQEKTSSEKASPAPEKTPKKQRRSRWRKAGWAIVILLVPLIGLRLAAPKLLRWYVNRTIDQSPMYDGMIGDIDLHVWRGAYSINDVRLIKTTGNVPVPLFAAKRVDLAMQWDALFAGELVGRIAMEAPELNFVDAESDSQDQTGVGGPWLEIIRDLFPFKINSTQIHNGSIHFRAFQKDPPVDLYLSHVEASIDDLTNIHDQITPLIATVKAKALAMDQGDFEFQMKLDPFSYRPTFQLALRLVGLDVTKTNSLMRAYGAFDAERGYFDLVVELDAREGQLEGYVKPLFRNLKVLSLKKDVAEDNVLGLFWEALVGTATGLLKNQPRDQFGTVIPLRGNLTNPSTSILNVVGNVLRNAFIRAYLPKLQGGANSVDGLEFGPGSVTDRVSLDNQH